MLVNTIFDQIRSNYSFREIVEHYLEDELVRIGEGTFEPSSKSCPWCGHKDCFRAKSSDDTEADIGLIKCFSCDRSATDATGFLKSIRPELNNFQAAERILEDAEVYGFRSKATKVPFLLQSTGPRETWSLNPSPRLIYLFNKAADFYTGVLQSNAAPARYQQKTRHHDLDTLKRYRVGFSNGNLGGFLRSLKFTDEEIAASGLVKGNGTDFFPKDVYVYAHLNRDGNACHFTIKDPSGNHKFQLPKGYRLGGTKFYGEQTLASQHKHVVLVEGENDFLSLIESGCRYPVLATIGQLSISQISWLSEHCGDREIITFFDTDEAGEKYRSKMAAAGLKNLKQYVLPDLNSDPDEYLKKGHTFEEMMQNSRPWQADPQLSLQQDTTAKTSSVDLAPNAFVRADTGNADLLKALADGKLRYVIEHKAWAWFDGQYWRTHQDHKATEYAREVGRLRLVWAQAMPEGTEQADDAKKSAISFAYGCLNLARINAMVTLASRDRALIASASDFDNDSYLLGALNGIVDLRSGKLLPFDPTLMLTKHCAANYNPATDCPLWKSTLERALNDGDAKEAADVARYLQKVFGMALIGRVLERSFFFIHGRPGTGKSLTTNAVTAVLKDYALELSPNSLMQASYHSNDIKMPEIVKLKGVRFALASEADDGHRFNEALVKRITGQDSINARDLGEKAITFKPQCTLFIVGNSRPSANGSDAFWRRLKVVSFNNQVPKAQQDSNMEVKLLQEADGILTWLIQGCLAYQEEGLGEPERVARDSAAYRADLDVISQFIEDRCELSGEYRVPAQRLYEAYTDWAENVNGSAPLGRIRFYEKLNESGLKKSKSRQSSDENPIAQIHGLRLKKGHFPPF